MNFKHVIALFVALVIPICVVHSMKLNATSNSTGMAVKTNNQTVTLYRSRRCYTDKYYELKRHEFDSLLSLIKFKFVQFLLLIVWIKQIWLRVLAVPLSKAGIEFTKADLQGPFQHLLGIKNEPIAKLLNPGIHGEEDVHKIRGIRVEELEDGDHVVVRSKRADRTKSIPALVLQAATETIFAPFIALYKLVKAVFQHIFRKFQFIYDLYEYDTCRYKTVCQVTEYVWDVIPSRVKEFLLAYIGMETLDKMLQSENEYLNAIVTGILELDCNASYTRFC